MHLKTYSCKQKINRSTIFKIKNYISQSCVVVRCLQPYLTLSECIKYTVQSSKHSILLFCKYLACIYFSSCFCLQQFSSSVNIK